MNVRHLVRKEIRHKKFSFLTGVFSLAAATAGLIAAGIILRSHDAETERIQLGMEKRLRSEMAAQEDYYRRLMRDMGYNVLIVHADQDMGELRSLGHPTEYFEYEDVWKLAHGELHTLNHLLPVLQERVYWEEAGMEIMLSGLRGQVPVFTKPEFLTDEEEYRSPITERVPGGKADLGFAAAVEAGLGTGARIKILGEEFTVNRVYPQRGTTDDITVWVPLGDAQAMLGRPGKINGIFALECVCDLDELGGVTEEVKAILPHAKVFEFTSLISARAGVRQRAEEARREVVGSVMAHRESLREEKERFASVIIPLLIAGAGIWIFVLVYNNTRERSGEIAVLRAVGFGRRRVFGIFMAKSLFMGVSGGLSGAVLGAAAGLFWGRLPGAGAGALVDPASAAAGVLLAVALSFLAGFFPVLLAANRDPADILREE